MTDVSTKLDTKAAVALFDDSTPATCAQMIGRWFGEPVDTGHPMDGMLAASYWKGKEFREIDTVYPLIHDVPVFGEVRINPALLPVDLVTALPFRDTLLPFLFPVFALFLHSRRPRARLRPVEFRGRIHAAMIYDGLPIIDYFACPTPDRVLGWMERRGDAQPFFFALTRDDPGG